MKLSIVYDTRSGNTAHMAEYIIEGMRQVEGVEARAFDLDAVNEQYVRESAALIVGTPTYNGTFTARLKGWLESAPSKLKLAGKLGGAYATAAYIHGGGDVAIQATLMHMLVAGMLIYSSGAAFGAPVIHFGPVAIAPDLDSFAELFRTYGRRMAQQAVALG